MTHDRRGRATVGAAAGAKLSTGAFAVRLSVYYAALCLFFGVNMPFFPVWLDAKGLNAAEIGLVLALPMIVRVLTVPFIAREADRRNALQLAILLASFASVIAYVLLGLSSGIIAITLIFIAASIAFTPIMPLTEAYALHELPRRGRAYGPVRVWGSVSFIAATIGAGYLADLIAPGNLIWAIVAMLCVNALGALWLPRAEPHPHTEESPRASSLLRNPAFIAVIAAAGLIQASHATFYGFSTLGWKASGIGGVTIGLLWSIGVIAEIVLFAMSARLPAYCSPANLLLVGAVAGMIRWTVMATDPPFWMLPFLQSLHALTYGATHLGTLGLVTRIAPRRLGATAQSYLSIVLGLTMAVATGLAGALFEVYGALSYAAMAVLAGAGTAIAVYGRAMWRERAS
jgi:PPP family 3-phenylpropionic acid transporter